MMDLIDRSEVQYKMIEILPEADSLEWYEQAKPEEVKDLVDELYNIVLDVNRIDAQPVKRGKWDYSYDGITPVCTVCRKTHSCIRRNPDYCPNCGSYNGGDENEIHS